ncbi:mitotic spindle assembly checkpoint protein MAD2B-like [Gigantopelta aegis]|uniref:mitotic spindle assembly checkpoint protein MAD2B-like n=1 Tax=Gigantopelta aegis TaxID=1735272 RepID=UPI001B88914E|nr:mitotic spindle assembly checkpoint protein MAD2B-like [Gigantopelta aegis]
MDDDRFDVQQVSCDILKEFLETAIHCVLYIRGLYPPGVFEKTKKYNVPIQMCVHPEVTQYISSLVDGVTVLLEKRLVDKVVIVILRGDNSPVENFVFEICGPLTKNRTDNYLYDLEQSLRAFILKLNICDGLLQPLPSDCSWTLHVHTRDSAIQKLEEKQDSLNFPWVEADEKEQTVVDSKLVPLKSMKSNLFQMQLYVEESEHKT